jgi:tight adherence protein B
MITLLVLLAGLGLLAAAGTLALRRLLDHERRKAKVAARMVSLRPSTAEAGAADALLGPESGPQFLRVRFARADLHVQRRTVVVAIVAVTVPFLAVSWLGKPLYALAGVALLAAVTYPALEFVAARNVAALQRELPFLLDSIRQHLAVGASLQQAMTRAVEQGGPGVRRHFVLAVRRMQNGATLVESLNWLAARLELPEVDMLAVAVQTNTRFGGAMSPTLSNLSHILRDRARVGRELKGATAETRLSGWVLAGLPVMAIFAITFMNHAYAAFLTSTPTGRHMLVFAFGFQAAGCLVMSRIMRLDF